MNFYPNIVQKFKNSYKKIYTGDIFSILLRARCHKAIIMLKKSGVWADFGSVQRICFLFIILIGVDEIEVNPVKTGIQDLFQVGTVIAEDN